MKKRFRSPIKLHADFKDICLWAFKANAGGGSWKLILVCINVEKPQILNNTQIAAESTAPDSPEITG